MSKTFSGKQVVKLLCREFDFIVASQRGSHVKLVRSIGNKTVTTIVPLHSELAKGTMKGVLELAGIEEKDFWKAVRK